MSFLKVISRIWNVMRIRNAAAEAIPETEEDYNIAVEAHPGAVDVRRPLLKIRIV
jgi:hypothetical protein